MRWLKKILGIEQKEETLELVLEELAYIRDDIQALAFFIGEMPAPCDKCENYEHPDYLNLCIKCESTGIVKHKTLRGWPWDD